MKIKIFELNQITESAVGDFLASHIYIKDIKVTNDKIIIVYFDK